MKSLPCDDPTVDETNLLCRLKFQTLLLSAEVVHEKNHQKIYFLTDCSQYRKMDNYVKNDP